MPLVSNFLSHPPRRIRSYVIRAGRMTGAQRHQLTCEHPCLFRLSLQSTPAEVSALQAWLQDRPFAQPLALDIGFGMGDSTVALAQCYPQYAWHGVDVYPPGVGRLLHLAQKANLPNLRVIEGDSWTVLECLADATIYLTTSFFPDPWPKQRHHKRRLIQSGFADLLAQKTTVEGCWHIATDIDDYALQIRQGLANHPAWKLIQDRTHQHLEEPIDPSLVDSRLMRPPTKFAARAIREGRRIHSLAYTRRAIG